VTTTPQSGAGLARRPRIPPVAEADDVQREALAKTLPGPDGVPLNIFTTLAHRPKLLRRVNSLGGYFPVHGSVPVREREIVILRTAAGVHSPYVLAHHRRLGREAGLRAEEIEAAIDPLSAHAWSPGDRALLRLAEELLAEDTVSDETWEALAEPWGDAGRLELLVLVGHYRMLGGLLNAVRVEVDA
jgi:4-carboxymuconolactone decarboxylase